MKFLMISPKNRTVYNFRGDLIKSIVAMGYEVVVTGPDRNDVEEIYKLGARFEEIPMNKTGTSVFGDLKYCWRLFSLLCKEKPDITLGYTVKPVVYGGIAAWFAGVKNINGMVTGGGYTFVGKTAKAKLLGIIVRMLYRVGFFFTDNIIFQNPDDMEEFCKKRLTSRRKCKVVNGSGVNMERFKPTSLTEKPVFFMLSRFLKSKGVSEYLKAAEIVKAEYPDAEFNILGKIEHQMQDAIDGSEIMSYAEKGIINIFPETSDVRPYYEKCNIYVLPSYREGVPRTVLEAMAMGRPIITTDTNGCRETVIDGVNGYLVPVGDVNRLAEVMKKFINDPESIERMGRESIRICKEKFEVNKVNDAMCKYLKIR